MGQVCLVEVKKRATPDTRQVVAQLFDYAASLWGQTLDEFRDAILRPYLRGRGVDDSVALEGFISASFGGDAEADKSEAVDGELVMRNLASTLERGTFVLVVAAPQIHLESNAPSSTSTLRASGSTDWRWTTFVARSSASCLASGSCLRH